MKRISIPLLTLATAFLLAAGCGDDDPLAPESGPEYVAFAPSPDSLMSLWRRSIENRDATQYRWLFDNDFEMGLDPELVSWGDLPPTHLTRAEAILAASNMFAGNEVVNWRGAGIPGVTRITIHEFVQVTPWETSDSVAGMELPEPGYSVSSHWRLGLSVDRGTGHTVLPGQGTYEFQVVNTPVSDQQDNWNLKTIRLIPVDGVHHPGWAELNLLYLTNEPPTAAFSVSDFGGLPWPNFQFDPWLSTDLDSGLAESPFRWKMGGMESDWSEWSRVGRLNWTFESEGPHTVTLEVRDRWGATDQATTTVTTVRRWLRFPNSRFTLLENFRSALDLMLLDEYTRLLHPEFQMILQESTVEQYPDLGSTIDHAEDLRIQERMFSGNDVIDPEGIPVPGMVDIKFSHWDRGGVVWQVSPPDDPIPGVEYADQPMEIQFDRGEEYAPFSVAGQIRFYVTSRDSLHEGHLQPYYQLIGMVDLTGPGNGLNSLVYGSLKALYR